MIQALLIKMLPILLSIASIAAPPTPPPSGTSIPELTTFLGNLEIFAKDLGGAVFLLCVSFAAIMRMGAGSNERRVAASNMAFTAAVVGLVLLLLAQAFQTFIQAAV